jgi:ABC-2 type transport system ATP-binding protein
MGYMPEAVPLYPEMRVAEYLAFRAELKRVPSRLRRSFVDDAMEKSHVTEVATTLIGKLSKGYRQRVGLADALVARPPILVLDEPTAGLDPNQIREVRALVKELGKEHTILLSTHILSEVEASCTRVLLIAKGKLVAEGPTKDIQKMRRPRGLEVSVRGKTEEAERILKATVGVTKVSRLDEARGPLAASSDDVVTLRCTWGKKLSEHDAGLATEAAVAALVAAGVGVREARPFGGSLEEVFAELTLEEKDQVDEGAAA